MLVDEVTIHIKAGKGGDGAVSFSKIPQVLGPTGGDGGDGGSVYVEGVSNLSALRQFRFKKDFFAQDGENGKVRNQSGRAGDDLVLKIPVGTIIHNLDKKERIEVLEVGKRILVAYGGKGGKGNNFFKSSTNTSPMQSEAGRPGQEFECLLELQLIADIGLIGLPNAGKSSLLNELTRAAAKVANYPFTTLEPNLGVYYGPNDSTIVLADIPGLIEGASGGKGLGIKFLRHIARTKQLVHCIASDSEDMVRDYKTIRAELKAFDPALLKKKEIILLTKVDLISEDEVKERLALLKKLNSDAFTVSIKDKKSLDGFKKFLTTEK